MEDQQQRPSTTNTQELNSAYHRQEAPFGHNHCPNCQEAFPPELLFPVKVGNIVKVVWKQNKQEKDDALQLAKQNPRKLIEQLENNNSSTTQQMYQEGGDNNNSNSNNTLAMMDPESLVPLSLYNMKSPDWAELPPCISRYRLSLFQLRLNSKLMEKMTVLCENCYYSFFNEDPMNPSQGFNSTFGSSTNSPNNNTNKRTPMKPSMTFEDYLAQSRFPDRSKDFAYSDTGRAMRHAAAEHKAKQQIKTALFQHLDQANDILMTATLEGGGRNKQLNISNNMNEDGAGGVTWFSENANNTAVGRPSTSGSLSLINNQQSNLASPKSLVVVQQQQQQPNSPSATIRFLLDDKHKIASLCELAVDALPVSVLDVSYSDWLQRELWDDLGKIMDYGQDRNYATAKTATKHQQNDNNKKNEKKKEQDTITIIPCCVVGGEDVPLHHPFFELYSKNRLRIPNPPNSVVSEKISRWSKPKRDEERKPVEDSFVQDHQRAKNATIPDNLNDQERRCLISILAGHSLVPSRSSGGGGSSSNNDINRPSSSTTTGNNLKRSSSSVASTGTKLSGQTSRNESSPNALNTTQQHHQQNSNQQHQNNNNTFSTWSTGNQTQKAFMDGYKFGSDGDVVVSPNTSAANANTTHHQHQHHAKPISTTNQHHQQMSLEELPSAIEDFLDSPV